MQCWERQKGRELIINVVRRSEGASLFRMALRHRLLTVSCLLLILSYPAGTQNASTTAGSPPDQSIESLLASGQPRLVARGAHEALVTQRRDLIPDLLSLAAQWQALPPPDPDKWRAEDDLPQDQLDERDAMAAVVDSLIQMNASVPADMLGTLAPDFGNDVAVLLSPDANSRCRAPGLGVLPFASCPRLCASVCERRHVSASPASWLCSRPPQQHHDIRMALHHPSRQRIDRLCAR